MQDFKKLNSVAFRYHVYLKEDGKTFVHFSRYQHEDIQQQLLETPSFKSFQQQRDESGLERTPVIEVLQPVASSHLLFDEE
ncbi:hypothetical protein AAG747_06750 [Rapidithrix thailandica]|uniref:Uncharacterized protein n=1 Tax=Rapidithrix thailandica TaxID=413964 RepID=A0AAW9S1X2_9BACT